MIPTSRYPPCFGAARLTRSFKIIRQHQHIQLFVSPVLLEELGEVLNRPSLANRLSLIGRAPHEVLADYYDAVEVVTPVSVPPVVANDADDDHVVATAVAAEADFLVSGDRDLLTIRAHAGIRIVNPAEALEILGETAPRRSEK